MILEWKVKCDVCGKIINALEESFIQSENGETCMGCHELHGDL